MVRTDSSFFRSSFAMQHSECLILNSAFTYLSFPAEPTVAFRYRFLSGWSKARDFLEYQDVRDDFKDGNESFVGPGRQERRHPDEPCSDSKISLSVLSQHVSFRGHSREDSVILSFHMPLCYIDKVQLGLLTKEYLRRTLKNEGPGTAELDRFFFKWERSNHRFIFAVSPTLHFKEIFSEVLLTILYGYNIVPTRCIVEAHAMFKSLDRP